LFYFLLAKSGKWQKKKGEYGEKILVHG